MVAVVAALAVVGIGSSTASAVTAPGSVGTCNGVAYSSAEALLACLVSLSKSVDVQPKDMVVGAPSSVIKATSSGNTAADVSRWRPNTPTWTQTTTKLAGSTSVTTADIANTGRWQPKLVKALKVGGGAASLIAGDTLLTWVLRDGVLYPVFEAAGVEDARGTVEDTYCVRHGNIATDWLGSWVGAECAEWRLNQDFDTLFASRFTIGPEQCYAGYCVQFTGVAPYTNSGKTWEMYCAILSGTVPANGALATSQALKVHYKTVTGSGQIRTLQNESLPHVGATQVIAGNGCTFTSSKGLPSPLWGYDGGKILGVTFYDPVTGKETEGLTESTQAVEWLTRVRCADGTIRLSMSEAFQEAELGQIARPESVQLDGCKPVGVDVGVQKAGTGTSGAGGGWDSVPDPGTKATGDRVQVGGAEVPEPVRDWQVNTPSCWDGSCRLILKKVVGAGELDCFDVPDQCIDWFTETKTNPSTYRCYYAGQLVALSECNVYARVFDREKVQQGTGYADPETGEEVKTSTGTTTTTNPGAAKVAMEQPVQDASQSRECWPTGWGVFNPFEWVMKPVQCALEWAFVPRTSKVTQLQTNIRMAAVNSKPAQVVYALEAWALIVPSASGCMGPEFRIDFYELHWSGYPFQACTGPVASAASITRLALGITFVIAGVIAVTRYIGRVFGFTGIGGGVGE